MKARRLVPLAVAALFLTTACGMILKNDERAWCVEHPQQVLAASYRTGGPLTMDRVLAEGEADTPSPEYVRACRRAYQDG